MDNTTDLGPEGLAAIPDARVDSSPVTHGPPNGGLTFRHIMRLLVLKTTIPTVLIGAWLAVTYTHLVGSIFLPTPTALVDDFSTLGPQLPRSLLYSVSMTLLGFGLGVTLGLAGGLAISYSRTWRDMVGSLFDFLRPVPVFALIPLFVLWFGIGRTPQIVLIALGTSVIMGVTTVEAVRNVPPIYVAAALTLGASRWFTYRRVIIPSIVPHLVGAVRVAAAASWGLDVAAEFIGAQTGLGYLMIVREQYLDTAGIVDIVLIYCLLAIVLDLLLRILALKATHWTERTSVQGTVASVLGAA